MPDGTELGERIRQYRLVRNLTLKQVEQKAKVSATHISEIERGLTSPTVGTLIRIAAALGANPADFVGRDALPAVSVVRRGSRRHLVDDLWGARVHLLSTEIASTEMTVAELEFARGPRTIRPLVVAGEVFVHVLDGSVEVTVGTDTHILSETESIHFAGRRPHGLRAAAAESARVLWVVSPAIRL